MFESRGTKSQAYSEKRRSKLEEAHVEGSLMLSFSYCLPILPQDTVLKKAFN